MTLWQKIKQTYALTNPKLAYKFACLNIPGTDITECQKVSCKFSGYACLFARDIPGADIEYCQKHACKNSYYAYSFARFIPLANIEYCQKYSCKEARYSYYFAKDIPGADIEYCRKACEGDEYLLKEFDKMIVKKVLV